MSRIRSKDTKPELVVRQFLFAKGFRYRLHERKLPGSPDLVLPKYKAVIFVHGCFWHGHEGCRYYKIPKTRTIWWKNKIDKNMQRDKKNAQLLINMGWKIFPIFECELRAEKRGETLKRLLLLLKTRD